MLRHIKNDWQLSALFMTEVAVSFVDRIIFGRTNYSREVSSFPEHKVFYNRCARRVIEFCDEHGIAYHIKDGTLTELEDD